MQRLVEKKLRDWAASARRKPLIIRGARQVGKSHSVASLGRDGFSNKSVTVNFEANRKFGAVFQPDLDAKRLLAELEVLTDTKITPGETLLFLDEIQACPRAITALRYFYEEIPRLHVIAAGSLLEFALGESSFPVGRVQFLTMHPLGFGEFLRATGKDKLAELVFADPLTTANLPSATAHAAILEELRKYFFVGGLPEAVKVYAETGSLRASFEVHGEIVEAYRQDFAKYKPAVDPACLTCVLETVARQVGQQVRYSHLAEDFSSPTSKKAFELLHQARLITKIESASPAGLPLGATATAKRVKAIPVDIGLMHHLSALSVPEEWARKDLLAIYQGAMAEQFVGQELRLAQEGGLYYWSRAEKQSSAEVDYLVIRDGGIYPAEVKAGPAGRLKSLHLALKLFPNCRQGWVFSTARFSRLKEQKLTFLPLYTPRGHKLSI